MKGSFNSEAATIQKPQVQLNCCCSADGALIAIGCLQLHCLDGQGGACFEPPPSEEGEK